MKKVEFAEVVYTIGSWALSYLVNGDASGLEDKEQAQVDRWLDDAVSSFTDDDGQRWEFSHEAVDTDSRLEFGYDEITGLRGDVYTVTMYFNKGESK
jgi:hypothetical protein